MYRFCLICDDELPSISAKATVTAWAKMQKGCKCMQKYSKLCKSVQGLAKYVKIDKIMQTLAKRYAKIFQCMPKLQQKWREKMNNLHSCFQKEIRFSVNKKCTQVQKVAKRDGSTPRNIRFPNGAHI